jgi:hypothetical protein
MLNLKRLNSSFFQTERFTIYGILKLETLNKFKYSRHLESIKQYYQFNPEPSKLVSEEVNDDYVVLTQLPNYKQIPEFQDEHKKKDLIFNLKLRFLRYYQVEAIKAVQQSVTKAKSVSYWKWQQAREKL